MSSLKLLGTTESKNAAGTALYQIAFEIDCNGISAIVKVDVSRSTYTLKDAIRVGEFLAYKSFTQTAGELSDYKLSKEKIGDLVARGPKANKSPRAADAVGDGMDRKPSKEPVRQPQAGYKPLRR